jgi:hypothetical protein
VRNNYREQKKIFDEALRYEDDDSSEIDPDEIDFLVDDLFKLELNGKTLKSIVDNIKSKPKVPSSSKSSSGSNNNSQKLPFVQTRSKSFYKPVNNNQTRPSSSSSNSSSSKSSLLNSVSVKKQIDENDYGDFSEQEGE